MRYRVQHKAIDPTKHGPKHWDWSYDYDTLEKAKKYIDSVTVTENPIWQYRIREYVT